MAADLPSTPQAMRRCLVLLARVAETNSPDLLKMEAMRELFTLCHWDNNNFRMFQNAVCNHDGVHTLLSASTQAQSEDFILWCFSVLGQMGFCNDLSSAFVGKNTRLVKIVVKILRDDSWSTKVQKKAIYALTNTVANAWGAHSRLAVLFPHLVRILETSKDKELQSQCVLTLGNFAYNPESRQGLVDAGAVLPLYRVMRSGDPELLITSAALAMANLMQHSQSTPPDFATQSIKLIMAAFEATVRGSDFPPGSSVYYTDWKLAMGLCNLSADPRTHEPMRGSGLLALLETLLSAKNPDPRLIRASLTIFWRLSHDQKDNAHQVRTNA